MISRIQRLFDQSKALLTGTPAWVSRYEQLVESLGDPQAPEYDLVYILPPAHYHGWILDAICREIDAHVDGRTTSAILLKDDVPPARAYFYSHYGYMRDTVLRQPEVLHGTNLLFYTHPKELWYSDAELMYVMNMADCVVSMCSLFGRELIREGIPQDRMEVALVGADAARFQPHTRGTGKVGLCSGYVPRKGGDRILELVAAMPDHSFALCGQKWQQWERFSELSSLPNFDYIEIPYSQYHEFYNSIDVFVSMSELEGGPVPLIEAAMCNAVPVCSDTGHAADIITHGDNGYLFSTTAPISEIRALVEQAKASPCDVRSTVEHLTWKRFSHQIQEIAGLRHRNADGTQQARGAA